MNKFFTAILALLLAVSAIAPAPHDAQAQVASSACVQFNRDLKQGSRDSDPAGVWGLQSFLKANGYLSVQPTGFFGSLTLTAVKKFQGDNGISQTGYVGPITRAKISAANCSAVNASGCTSASGFSVTTGRPCAPVEYPPGCASLSGYSTTTGLICASSTPAVTTTVTTITYPAGCASKAGFSSTTGKRCDGSASTTTTTTTIQPDPQNPASSSSGSSSSASQSVYPEGCTSFSGSSVITDMPCDGSAAPEPASGSSCEESNYNPETGQPC